MENRRDKPIHANRMMRVICIGAGPSGLYLAYMFKTSFTDYTLEVYEKNEDIGGTWFENRYPGCEYLSSRRQVRKSDNQAQVPVTSHREWIIYFMAEERTYSTGTCTLTPSSLNGTGQLVTHQPRGSIATSLGLRTNMVFAILSIATIGWWVRIGMMQTHNGRFELRMPTRKYLRKGVTS